MEAQDPGNKLTSQTNLIVKLQVQQEILPEKIKLKVIEEIPYTNLRFPPVCMHKHTLMYEHYTDASMYTRWSHMRIWTTHIHGEPSIPKK